MSSRLTLAGRELGSLRREKTVVLAVLIQLFVAAFSSFMVVGLVSLYDPGAAEHSGTLEVGVVGNASDDLAPAVDAGERRTVVRFSSSEAGLRAFVGGEVDALLTATEGPDGRVEVRAVAPEGNVRTTLVVAELKDALSTFEREKRQQLVSRLSQRPVPAPPDVPTNPYYDFIYTVLVPLLAFLPVFISGSVVTDSLTEEIERGTLELLRVAPVSLATIVDGKALALVLLAPAQAALWLLLLGVNGIAIANPLSILALVTAFAVAFVALGAGVALRVRERRAAQLLYSMAVIGVFAGSAALPEGPTAVVAKLAVDSPTAVTRAVVLGSIVLAAGGYALLRYRLERHSRRPGSQ